MAKRERAAELADWLSRWARMPVTVTWEATSGVGRGSWWVRWTDGPSRTTLQAVAEARAPFLGPLTVSQLRWGHDYSRRAWALALITAADTDPEITDWRELLGTAEAWLDDADWPDQTRDTTSTDRVDRLLSHDDGRESSMAHTLLLEVVTKQGDGTIPARSPAPVTQSGDETGCPVCGRPVPHPATGRPARYCSPACRTRAWRTRTQPVTKQGDVTTCPVCGRTTPHSRTGRPAQYCSPVCRTRAWRSRTKTR